MRVRRQIITLALAAGAAAGCTQFGAAPSDPAVRTVAGTVKYLGLEGGFYAIVGSDRVTYDPLNLPAEFRHDGLAVRATLRVRDDMAGIHMVGPIVEVLRIERQ
jgi:hypothetical protein